MPASAGEKKEIILTHHARLSSMAHPVEDAFDVPEFRSRREEKAEPAPRSWDERLAAVESSASLMFVALQELALASAQQNEIIAKLIEIPGDVKEALTALANDQSNVNLNLALKLDMQQTLVAELQDIVEDLREDLAELDDDPLADEAEPTMFFDIETMMEPNDIFDDLTYVAVGADNLFTHDFDAEDGVIPENIFADEEPSVEYVSVEDDWIVVALPARPEPADAEAQADFDDFLHGIVSDAADQKLASDQIAEDLHALIDGVSTDDPAVARLPRDESAGVKDSMQAWWEHGGNASIHVHMLTDFDVALTQIIALASAYTSLASVMAILLSAVSE